MHNYIKAPSICMCINKNFINGEETSLFIKLKKILFHDSCQL